MVKRLLQFYRGIELDEKNNYIVSTVISHLDYAILMIQSLPQGNV